MKYSLITGASQGIGREFGKLLASKGQNIILTARSKEPLEELADTLKRQFGISCLVFVCDLAKPQAVSHLIQYLHTEKLEVDLLINNAGFGDFGPFANSSTERSTTMIQVNIIALTELTRALLPDMISAKNGRILNIASTAAFQPGPFMAVYYATKAYVLSFSEALSEELATSGVVVTALCPGPTRSNFHENALMNTEGILKTMPMPSAKEVAAYGWLALEKSKAVAVHGTFNNLLIFAERFLPRILIRKVIRRLQEKRK